MRLTLKASHKIIIEWKSVESAQACLQHREDFTTLFTTPSVLNLTALLLVTAVALMQWASHITTVPLNLSAAAGQGFRAMPTPPCPLALGLGFPARCQQLTLVQ